MVVRIVIVGGGAGGLELATGLGRRLGAKGKAHITLVDRAVSHVWKPLLHEVATGVLTVSENELNYFAQARWNNFEFQFGELDNIDRRAKKIHLASHVDSDGKVILPERELSYDRLVIAVGSTTNDFNTPGVVDQCMFLDNTKQAERFHQKLLATYVRAHSSETTQELRIGIVGAGATGVELAAELRNASLSLSAYGMKGIRPENVHITVLEAGARVLPALPERIGAAVHEALKGLGITVLTGAAVKSVTAEGFHTADGNFCPATLKVWAAGIRAPSFLQNLDGLEANRINQLVVRPTLQCTLDDDIFALGDCAACPKGLGMEGQVPPRAQAAHQQASMLAASFERQFKNRSLLDYQYVDYGSLVSLSRFSAVGNLMGGALGSVKIEGWLAKTFYISLYRMHQLKLYGYIRTGLMILAGRLGRSTRPKLKLH